MGERRDAGALSTPRLGPYVERFLLAAAGAATLVTLVAACRNSLGPYQRPATFGLVFWKWELMAWVVAGAVAGGSAWLLDRRLGAPWALRGALGALALHLIAATVALNRRAFVNLWGMESSAAFRWECLATAAAASATLIGAALLPLRARWALRGCASLALAAFALAFRPTSPPPPPPSELGRMAPASSGQRLLFVGIDGASWTFMEPLIARGDLPNIAALRARGSSGPLETLKPTYSPALWTTFATGRPPRRHGVEDFTVPLLRGVDNRLPELVPVPALGFGWLTELLRRSGQIFDSPVTSESRRVPALWNLASSQRSPLNVVTWYVTWPVEPLLGTMVSDTIFFYPAGTGRRPDRVTFPAQVYGDVAPDILRADEVSIEVVRRFMETTPAEFAAMGKSAAGPKSIRSEFRWYYANFETTRRIALRLMEADRRRFGKPQDMLVYFPIVDKTKHRALEHSELSALPHPLPEPVRTYGRVVTEAYKAVDKAIGELAVAFGEGNILLVSDHGFSVEDHFGVKTYAHFEAPDGFWLGAGPAFGQHRDVRLSIYDVFPLVTRIKGFPLSRALTGRVPEEILASGAVAGMSTRMVADYGRREAVTAGRHSDEVDAEMLEGLRALGYIR